MSVIVVGKPNDHCALLDSENPFLLLPSSSRFGRKDYSQGLAQKLQVVLEPATTCVVR